MDMKGSIYMIFVALLLASSSIVRAEVYAVVIGINEYPGADALSFAEDDAYLFALTLMTQKLGKLRADNLFVLTDEAATRQHIDEVCKYVVTRARPEDKIFFYFTGHGTYGGLVLWDGEHHDIYPYERLRQLFGLAKAQDKYIILDACKSGSLYFSSEEAINAFTRYASKPHQRESMPRFGNSVVLMSSRLDESSYETRTLRHGIFTYYLCKGLNGKADRDGNRRITLEELYIYTRGNTYNFKKQGQASQCPVIMGHFDRLHTIAKT